MAEIREDSKNISVVQVLKCKVYDGNLEVGEGVIYYDNNGYRVGKLYSLLDNQELEPGNYDIQPYGDWHIVVTRDNNVRH